MRQYKPDGDKGAETVGYTPKSRDRNHPEKFRTPVNYRSKESRTKASAEFSRANFPGQFRQSEDSLTGGPGTAAPHALHKDGHHTETLRRLAEVCNKLDTQFNERAFILHTREMGHLLSKLIDTLEGESSDSPSTIATALRHLPRYFSAAKTLAQYSPSRMFPLPSIEPSDILARLLRLWTRVLDENPRSVSLESTCSAIAGLCADKGAFIRSRDPNDTARFRTPTLAEIALSDSCKLLTSQLVERDKPLNRAEVISLVTTMRTMTIRSVVAPSFLQLVHDKLWSKESDGLRLIERPFARNPLGNRECLHEKLSELFSASVFWVTDKDALESVEAGLSWELRRGFVTTYGISDYLVACVAHKHRNESLLNTIENHLRKTYLTGTSDSEQLLVKHGAALSLATLCLLILLAEPTEDIEGLARKTVLQHREETHSKLENTVFKAAQALTATNQDVISVTRSRVVGPCEVDIEVQMRTSDRNVVPIALEVDGFPFHSVYDIDLQQFSPIFAPLRDWLRDLFLSARRDRPVLRISATDVEFHSNTESLKKFLLASLRDAAGQWNMGKQPNYKTQRVTIQGDT